MQKFEFSDRRISILVENLHFSERRILGGLFRAENFYFELRNLIFLAWSLHFRRAEFQFLERRILEGLPRETIEQHG